MTRRVYDSPRDRLLRRVAAGMVVAALALVVLTTCAGDDEPAPRPADTAEQRR